MDKPVIAERSPSVLELQPGMYYWCRCGRSKSQPFFDDFHKPTAFTPMEFKIDASKRVALCRYKHTDNQPFCDATHKRLPTP